MKQILRANALESWASAISYCNQIMDGNAILSNQKFFVSSLQNSIELFTKQHMLNKCDYRVIEFTRMDSSGEPLKSYLSANNLNDYMKNCINDVKCKSIDFSKIIDCFKEIFEEYFDQHNNTTTVKSALNRLKQLRNDETHFYIDGEDFLKEADFVSLFNLMVDFYEILKHYHLLPYNWNAQGENNRFVFNKNRISSFSYRAQLKQSQFVKKLKENIKDKPYPTSGGNESYSIAEDILTYSEAYESNDFNKIWAYIEMLLRYKMLIIKDYIEYDNIEGHYIQSVDYRTYSINI